MSDVSSLSQRNPSKMRAKTPSVLDSMAITRDRVAEQLLELRRLHGTPDRPLSQTKAAARADVGLREWQRWEKRQVTPTTTSLGKVAEGFEVPLETFDDGQGDKSKTPLADRLDALDDKLSQLHDSFEKVASAVTALEARLRAGETALADQESRAASTGRIPTKGRRRAAAPKPP